MQQEGLTVTASSTGLKNVDWRYRLINAGDICGRRAFAVAPNNPQIHDSNRLVLPESTEHWALYRNRFACFEAVGMFNDSSWTHYGIRRIDLGSPVISVGTESVGTETYLQAKSNEDVTYRVIQFKYRPLGGIGGDGSTYGESEAGSYCEYLLVGGVIPSSIDWASWETLTVEDGRVLVESNDHRYCFEAVDSDGNYAYVSADGVSSVRFGPTSGSRQSGLVSVALPVKSLG